MNIFGEVEQRIRDALASAQRDGALPADLPAVGFEIQEARDPAHGELAANAALVLAKPARSKPRAIAELLASKLAEAKDITKVEVAGPGFLNLTFAPAFWHGLITAILAVGDRYGRSETGAGASVDIEYVSANPTGP